MELFLFHAEADWLNVFKFIKGLGLFFMLIMSLYFLYIGDIINYCYIRPAMWMKSLVGNSYCFVFFFLVWVDGYKIFMNLIMWLFLFYFWNYTLIVLRFTKGLGFFFMLIISLYFLYIDDIINYCYIRSVMWMKFFVGNSCFFGLGLVNIKFVWTLLWSYFYFMLGLTD